MTTAERRVDPILAAESQTECMLGNEAIVRGALESGVAFACGYPGTPSSEITDSFARLHKSCGITFEYSVNEKICVEMAFAASLAGARSICAMKHLGLMVAGDPMSTIPYIGVKAGMVIVSAADPSCRTSPNEHDQRHLGAMVHVPVLDPSTPQEALELTKFAFELSEAVSLPVLLRVTTRVCHTRAPVTLGAIQAPSIDGFVRDPKRYVPIPMNARRMRISLQDRIEQARARISDAGLFRREELSGEPSHSRERGNPGELVEVGALDPRVREDDGETQVRVDRAILAIGAPAATCFDMLQDLPSDASNDAKDDTAETPALWTLSAAYPLPEAQLVEALRSVRQVLVVEELSPFLENAVRELVARYKLDTEILGKRTGHLPEAFEYEPPVLQRGLRDAFNLGIEPAEANASSLAPVPRPPSLCPGCPHRAAYFAARAAFDEDQLFFNDIGCYTLGYGPPLDTADALVCMGAGFTLAAGVSRVTGKRTVGFLGDSTFFHSGIPALLNAIKERVNMIAVILDNEVTAMTGFQNSPTTTVAQPASIEAVVRGLGATNVDTIDPYDLASSISAFEQARDATGVSVVIVKRACPVNLARQGNAQYGVGVYEVDPDGCRTCGREEAGMRCGVCLSEGYEKQAAHTRAMQPKGSTEAPPSVAPCSRRCPLSLCVQGYIGNIAAGEYGAAIEQIASRTPLLETVCRVCHRPCEQGCIRRDIDEPIAINNLKRFVVGWAAEHSDPFEKLRQPDHDLRVAIVGAGPSGMAAAQDLRLRGYNVKVLDAKDKPGGVLAHAIPSYRLPDSDLQRDTQRVLDLGVEFAGGQRMGHDFSLQNLLDEGYDAIYVALGASLGRTLELPGEGPRQMDALRYLEAARRGDEGLDAKRVVVIGGGNAAVDAARTARRLGSKNTVMACLEARHEMPALLEEVVAAEHEGIVVHERVKPERFESEGIVVSSLDPRVRGDDGGAPDTTQETLMQADLVIMAIGQVADASSLEGMVDLTSDGRLKVNSNTCATSHAKVFGGGDLVGTDRTVTGAIAWGQRAAWGIDFMLRGEESADTRPPPTKLARLQIIESAPPGTRPVAPRVQPLERPLQVRGQDFQEVNLPLSEAQAKQEASRCLSCGWCGNCRACIDLFGCPAFREENGHAVIEPSLCNGCGVCADLCPNGAIRPRKAS